MMESDTECSAFDTDVEIIYDEASRKDFDKPESSCPICDTKVDHLKMHLVNAHCFSRHEARLFIIGTWKERKALSQPLVSCCLCKNKVQNIIQHVKVTHHLDPNSDEFDQCILQSTRNKEYLRKKWIVQDPNVESHVSSDEDDLGCVSNGAQTSSRVVSGFPFKWPEHKSIFSDSVLQSFGSEQFTDISLRCGPYIIPCHRAVLSCASVMLEGSLKDPSVDVIIIAEEDISVVRALLSYVYNGSVRVPIEILGHLLGLAHNLGIKSMKTSDSAHQEYNSDDEVMFKNAGKVDVSSAAQTNSHHATIGTVLVPDPLCHPSTGMEGDFTFSRPSPVTDRTKAEKKSSKTVGDSSSMDATGISDVVVSANNVPDGVCPIDDNVGVDKVDCQLVGAGSSLVSATQNDAEEVVLLELPESDSDPACSLPTGEKESNNVSGSGMIMRSDRRPRKAKREEVILEDSANAAKVAMDTTERSLTSMNSLPIKANGLGSAVSPQRLNIGAASACLEPCEVVEANLTKPNEMPKTGEAEKSVSPSLVSPTKSALEPPPNEMSKPSLTRERIDKLIQNADKPSKYSSTGKKATASKQGVIDNVTEVVSSSADNAIGLSKTESQQRGEGELIVMKRVSSSEEKAAFANNLGLGRSTGVPHQLSLVDPFDFSLAGENRQDVGKGTDSSRNRKTAKKKKKNYHMDYLDAYCRAHFLSSNKKMELVNTRGDKKIDSSKSEKNIESKKSKPVNQLDVRYESDVINLEPYKGKKSRAKSKLVTEKVDPSVIAMKRKKCGDKLDETVSQSCNEIKMSNKSMPMFGTGKERKTQSAKQDVDKLRFRDAMGKFLSVSPDEHTVDGCSSRNSTSSDEPLATASAEYVKNRKTKPTKQNVSQLKDDDVSDNLALVSLEANMTTGGPIREHSSGGKVDKGVYVSHEGDGSSSRVGRPLIVAAELVKLKKQKQLSPNKTDSQLNVNTKDTSVSDSGRVRTLIGSSYKDIKQPAKATSKTVDPKKIKKSDHMGNKYGALKGSLDSKDGFVYKAFNKKSMSKEALQGNKKTSNFVDLATGKKVGRVVNGLASVDKSASTFNAEISVVNLLGKECSTAEPEIHKTSNLLTWKRSKKRTYEEDLTCGDEEITAWLYRKPKIPKGYWGATSGEKVKIEKRGQSTSHEIPMKEGKGSAELGSRKDAASECSSDADVIELNAIGAHESRDASDDPTPADIIEIAAVPPTMHTVKSRLGKFQYNPEKTRRPLLSSAGKELETALSSCAEQITSLMSPASVSPSSLKSNNESPVGVTEEDLRKIVPNVTRSEWKKYGIVSPKCLNVSLTRFSDKFENVAKLITLEGDSKKRVRPSKTERRSIEVQVSPRGQTLAPEGAPSVERSKAVVRLLDFELDAMAELGCAPLGLYDVPGVMTLSPRKSQDKLEHNFSPGDNETLSLQISECRTLTPSEIGD